MWATSDPVTKAASPCGRADEYLTPINELAPSPHDLRDARFSRDTPLRRKIVFNAGTGIRTRTAVTGQGILSAAEKQRGMAICNGIKHLDSPWSLRIAPYRTAPHDIWGKIGPNSRRQVIESVKIAFTVLRLPQGWACSSRRPCSAWAQ